MTKKGKRSKQLISSSAFFILTLAAAVGILYLSHVERSLPRCANTLSCKESLTLRVENDIPGAFLNRPVEVPPIDLAKIEDESAVLGERTSTGEKQIFVDLSTQTLSAYEGDTLFMQTPISSGLWGRTPTGEFTIWIKLRSTRMSGGSGDDYYNLPNVPYVMFFSNDKVPASAGFSLHGTYWHNNFGHPMSHGCINMKTTDVEKLYHWASPVTKGKVTRSNKKNPGTKVTIYRSEE